MPQSDTRNLSRFSKARHLKNTTHNDGALRRQAGGIGRKSTGRKRFSMAFRKAERRKSKLRLAITGISGSGKTYGALLIAFGIGGKIAMIDTENGSGDLYSHLGEYDICSLTAPFTTESYLQLIHEAEQAGYDTIIIDSLSHAWSGEGGLLDMQAYVAVNKYRGNSYAAWRDVTSLQNQLVDTILQSPCHMKGE